jgi:hypothetical protein
MKRPLPSANRRVSETSRNLARGSMNLRVGAFNKIFPTLGRFVGRIDGGKPQQEKTDTVSRRTRASVDVGLSRSNDNLGTILNNQNLIVIIIIFFKIMNWITMLGMDFFHRSFKKKQDTKQNL